MYLAPADAAAQTLGRRSFLGPASLQAAAQGTLLSIDSPRLPGRPLLGFSHVDSVTQTGGRFGHGGATAWVDVSALDWVFDCHFQDDPVVPGTLMVDALLQLAGLYAAIAGFQGAGRATRIDGVRFLREVTPECSRVEYRMDVRRLHRGSGLVLASGEAWVGGNRCMAAERLAVCIIPRGTADVAE